MNTEKSALPFGEFVALMALMMSLVALTIDAILPALPDIGQALQVVNANDNQLLIALVFLGMALGQLLYGPLSDSFGRRPAVVLGVGVFLLGCLLSLFAQSFELMLLGRLLQGVGLGAPRIVSIAIIRDQFSGDAMARVVSFVMTLFILVPMIAPALGQAVLLFASWRAIFGVILGLGVFVLLWFMWRQPETLGPESRVPFSLRQVGIALGTIFSSRTAVSYTIASGFISGAFLAYLSCVQQIFQQQYQLGELFPLVFAALALAVGTASYLNGRLVLRLGMRFIVLRSLWGLSLTSLLFMGVAYMYAGHPPLWVLMIYFSITLFCCGILFGNMSALAMEPLGNIAGIGAAVVGSLGTLISLPAGIAIGRAYDETVLPLIIGFAACGVVSLAIMYWVERKHPPEK